MDKPFSNSHWITMPHYASTSRVIKIHRWLSQAKRAEFRRAPQFRYEFTMGDSVKSAILKICGLGYYEAWINHRRVGDHFLDPAQTDFEKRVFYASYDITKLVQVGKNCIGVMLGNGWYNQNRVWGKKGLPYGYPQLICELNITLADGSIVVIASNNSWKCAPGPVTDNNIYTGESYDARLEQHGWDAPGFDDSSWMSATPISGPGGKLELQEIPPIRKVEVLHPIDISPISEGRYVVDMGQNFSGWARIQVEAEEGSEIILRFAESLKTDGNIDTSSTGVFATKVEQIDRYIAKGEGVEVWEPRFTYHGFRYVEVSGWPGDLTFDNISGVVVHTDLRLAGFFECSDERLNKLHSMALWTHRSNIHSIPEDCPARERCGWLGDANFVAEYSMWNFHAKSFWEKYLGDIETTRSMNKGIPTNIAPGKRGTNSDANPDWAATFIMLPWYIFVQYGDLSVLEKHWGGMQQLMEYYMRKANNWILKKGYGDWFDPGGESICTNTPPSLTSTFWFYRCATVMSSTASALGLSDRVEQYAEWAIHIKKSAISKFYNSDTTSFGSQTANVMAIEFGLVPDSKQSHILHAIVSDIKERDIHLSTGIMGVRFLFEVLTQYGYGDVALALMHQNTYPSFGHLILRGATTIWEYWGEEKHDKVHGPRSLNHPMMAGFDNWFYTTLAGIRADPLHPGFKHFSLTPHPIPGLKWVRCYYDCPYGRIGSEWTYADEIFEWNVVVPQGTSATASLPFSHQILKLEPGQHKLVDKKTDPLSPSA